MTSPSGQEPTSLTDPRSLVEAVQLLVPGTSAIGPEDITPALLARACEARKVAASSAHDAWHLNAVATGFLVIELQEQGKSAFEIRVATGISERTQGRRAELARKAAAGEDTREGSFEE
jgi:hypothetical protein